MVGRSGDLLWVVVATHYRFYLRPTVGSFLTLSKVSVYAGWC